MRTGTGTGTGTHIFNESKAMKGKGGRGLRTCTRLTTCKYSFLFLVMLSWSYWSITTVALNARPRVVQSKTKAAKLHMISGSDLNVRIKEAVKRQYPVTGDRVVACWDNFVAGKKLNRYVDKDEKQECLQTADCFVDGLRAMPFHNTKDFPWVPALEENYKIILKELTDFENDRRGMSKEQKDLQELLRSFNVSKS